MRSMSAANPGPRCHRLDLETAPPLSDPAEVALEDYARSVSRAASAEAVRDAAGRVRAVHVCGLEREPEAETRRDVSDFARDLGTTAEAGGLGWS